MPSPNWIWTSLKILSGGGGGGGGAVIAVGHFDQLFRPGNRQRHPIFTVLSHLKKKIVLGKTKLNVSKSFLIQSFCFTQGTSSAILNRFQQKMNSEQKWDCNDVRLKWRYKHVSVVVWIKLLTKKVVSQNIFLAAFCYFSRKGISRTLFAHCSVEMTISEQVSRSNNTNGK